MRRVVYWFVIPLCLAGVAFWLTYSLLHSPRWSLYQIGKAVHDRDSRLFLAYVDIEQILRGQDEEITKLILRDRAAEDETRRTVKNLLNLFLGAIADQVRDRVAAWVDDPQRDNIPSSWTLVMGAEVDQKGDHALVVLTEPQSGDRLRVGMTRMPEGHWLITQVDAEDAKRLIRKYAPDVLGLEGEKPAAPPAPSATPGN
ncbi:MAG: DUF2939 domain-containing protein [Deltaproteobacteria bacterium]|nr:DUF2939 domain-containing protein [Deltaproteobacteria bacterium]